VKQFFIAFILALGVVTGANAATFYVAKTGSDSYSCTQAQNSSTPKLTINAALACVGTTPQAGAGQTVEVAAGTYTESIGPDLPSGTSWSSPFRLRAKAGNTVTIKTNQGNNVVLYQPAGISFYSIIEGFIFDGTNTGDNPQVAIGSCCDGPGYVRFLNNQFINNIRCMGFLIGRLSHHIELIGNKIHGGGFEAIGAMASGGNYLYPIYLQGSHNIIEGNEFYDFPSWGIHGYSAYTEKPNNNIIRGNKFNDFGWGDDRSSAILAYIGNGNQIYNNLVYNGSQGIAVGPDASNTAVYNNSVFNTRLSGISTAGSNTLLKNNIAYQTPMPISNSGSGTVMSNNLTNDPKFISGSDFRLQSGSPAIDTGANLLTAGITTDYVGGMRPQGCCYDIGAYEYGSSASSQAPSTVATLGVTVDSTYTGFSIPSINDGVISASGAQSTTWASDTSLTDHWINFTFPTTQQINTATIHWAFNDYQQKYMTAKKVDVQYWNGSSYQTVASLTYPGSDVPSSAVSFPTVITSRLRFVMPAGQGNPNYPEIFWVTEAKYGLASSQPPSTVATLGVTVDSTYTGFSIPSINDGIISASGAQSATWASDTSLTDHWINLAFPTPQQINTATIHWAFNDYQQKYMTAKKVDVQYWDGSGYRTFSSFVYPGSDVASSTITFPTVTISHLRFVMPAGQGNPTYSEIFWVTEVKYGMGSTVTSPSAPSNLALGAL
jgi:hypothetical protein